MRDENKVSIIDAIGAYFSDVRSAVFSVIGSCAAAFPYLVGIGESRKEVTEQYPDPISSKTEDDLPPRTRGLLDNDIETCTGCRECEKVCPTNCFTIETQPGADASKLWVATFDIDLSKCVFCGLCVEACQPQSLVHTKKYEGAARSSTGMIRRFGRGDVTPEQQDKWAAIRRQQEENTL
jgi:NAD(P)H-quinone oxidoreductase subunit I